MILGEVFAGLLAMLGAGLGAAVSSIALANRAAAVPEPAPVRRTGGFTLLTAGLIFWGVGWLGMRAAAGEDAVPPTLAEEVGWTLAGGVAAWLFLRIVGGGFPRATSGRGFGWTAVSYVCALPGLLGVLALNQRLVVWVHGVANWLRAEPIPAPEPTQDVLAGLQALPLGWESAGLALAVVLLHPVVEEALFRGYLWRALAARSDFGPRRALLFATLVFALVHGPAFWLPVAYLGAFFGWVCWQTGSVYQAMFAHLLHNAVGTTWAMLAGVPGP